MRFLGLIMFFAFSSNAFMEIFEITEIESPNYVCDYQSDDGEKYVVSLRLLHDEPKVWISSPGETEGIVGDLKDIRTLRCPHCYNMAIADTSPTAELFLRGRGVSHEGIVLTAKGQFEDEAVEVKMECRFIAN